MPDARDVIVYSRKGCHLCEIVKESLTKLERRGGFRWLAHAQRLPYISRFARRMSRRRNSFGTVLKINDGNMTEAFVQKALIRAGLATHESVEVSVVIRTSDHANKVA